MQKQKHRIDSQHPEKQNQPSPQPQENQPKVEEIGGTKGPEPTRYGDWENKGRCTDF